MEDTKLSLLLVLFDLQPEETSHTVIKFVSVFCFLLKAGQRLALKEVPRYEDVTFQDEKH